MKVKWLGHAAFLITSDTGTKIITDPYEAKKPFDYGPINESADVVTVSHDHWDHSAVAEVKGNPDVVKSSKKVKGIDFKGIATYHDEASGTQRGNNTIFCFPVDGMTVCHIGDLGHALSDKQVTEIGKVDILLLPVGGNYTIDAKVATDIGNKLKPKVIIPMHFCNDRCPAFPVAKVDDFLKGKTGVSKSNASEIEFKKEKLPAATQIVVLKPAL